MESEFEEEQKLVLNAESKQRLMAHIGQLPQGMYSIRIKRARLRRTQDANEYYFAAVVKPWQIWLSDQWGEKVSKDDAHKALAGRILGMHSLAGGIDIPRSTANLNIAEFSAYIENCARFLAQFAGIVVIPSDVWWEMHGGKPKAEAA